MPNHSTPLLIQNIASQAHTAPVIEQGRARVWESFWQLQRPTMHKRMPRDCVTAACTQSNPPTHWAPCNATALPCIHGEHCLYDTVGVTGVVEEARHIALHRPSRRMGHAHATSLHKESVVQSTTHTRAHFNVCWQRQQCCMLRMQAYQRYSNKQGPKASAAQRHAQPPRLIKDQ